MWLSDGIEDGGAAALAERLQSLGHVRLIEDSPTAAARILLPPTSEAGAMRVEARRLAANDSETIWLRARDGHGRLLAREALTFAAGSRRAEVSLGMPVEVRNQIERLELEGEDSAAVTVLLDERWRRRSVGLIAGRPTEGVQPLLGELYYLEHALAASAPAEPETDFIAAEPIVLEKELSIRELRARLLSYGLSTIGLKSELRARLEYALEHNRAQYQNWDPVGKKWI